jgi:hypothetical protein
MGKKLGKMQSTLSNYCSTRPSGSLGKQAPPCTKSDRKIIVSVLYGNTRTATDYLDAALVPILWYLYARSSDAEQLEKGKLCVYPGKFSL